MITVLFALSVTIYEIFANKITFQKCVLQNERQGEKARNGTCAI